MTDKEVRRLRRIELLEILIDQKKEIEELRARLAEARKLIERDDALIQRLIAIDTLRQVPVSPAPEADIPSQSSTDASDTYDEKPETDVSEPVRAEYEASAAPADDIRADLKPEASVLPHARTADDDDDSDFIQVRGLSAPINLTAWLTARESGDTVQQEGAADTLSEEETMPEDVLAQITSVISDNTADADEAAADGTEPAMTNEELDEYLQRLINEDDA